MSDDSAKARVEGCDGDPSWSHYAHTILELALPEPLRIDMRNPIPPSTSERLRQATPTGRFAVITPFNPRSVQLTDAENESRLHLLLADIHVKNIDYVRADGVSPDGLHRERGVLLSIPLEESISLAIRLQQSALFWFDGDAVWLVPALVSGTCRRLPMT